MGVLKALAILFLASCATTPDVEILPSGLLTVSHAAFAPLSDIEAKVLCVAKLFDLPSRSIALLTVEINHGYAVTCAGELMAGCYLPDTKRIKVPNVPIAYVGGFGKDFVQILEHELIHWALHVATGDADARHISRFFYTGVGCDY